ncbi:MAG: flavodoxin-dependent (E)-4-hydroxy-3-methylbut-2-enyl-diphosphate synthase [Planctomycetota bacterium]
MPIHLGVTEAGMPPDGVIKTRIAFEQLLPMGIGDTLRTPSPCPFENKGMEIEVGRQLIADIDAGRFRSVPEGFFEGSTSSPALLQPRRERTLHRTRPTRQNRHRSSPPNTTSPSPSWAAA